MVCIYCGGVTRVVNSRLQKRTNTVWRRRHCLNCGATATTQEGIIREKALLIKKDSDLEPFSRDKLFLSLYDSLRHRKTAITDASALSDTILGSCATHVDQGTVEVSLLATTAHGVLKRFDRPAAVYYQAHYMPS